jgi:hypothetical protein
MPCRALPLGHEPNELGAAGARLSAMCRLTTIPLTRMQLVALQSFCSTVFPSHSRIVLQRLMEVIKRGAPRYEAAAVGVMKAMFEVRRRLPGREPSATAALTHRAARAGAGAGRGLAVLGGVGLCAHEPAGRPGRQPPGAPGAGALPGADQLQR